MSNLDVQSKYWFVTIPMGPVNLKNMQKKANVNTAVEACQTIADHLMSPMSRRPPSRGPRSGLGLVCLKSQIEEGDGTNEPEGLIHVHAAFDSKSRKTKRSVINFFLNVFGVQADVRIRKHSGSYCNKEATRIAGPFNYKAEAMTDPSKRSNAKTMSHKIVADLIINEKLTRRGLWNHSLDAQVFFAKYRGYVENVFKLSTEFSAITSFDVPSSTKSVEEEE